MNSTLIGIIALVIALIVGPFATLRAVSYFRRPPAPLLPEGWQSQLFALLPMCATWPATLQARWLERVERFIAHKRFVGCNGLQVTDEMRLAIAGYACLLALRPGAQLYPQVRAVLLYPTAFRVPVTEPDEFGLVPDEPQERVGESWQGDRVILSWEDVQAALQGDEMNVVVHEFAHQLDDETPEAEGAPPLRDDARWADVMQREYARLQRHRRPPVLDPYGAESPAEFFGVVVESFIQRGAELRQHHAELYALLCEQFGFETADWFAQEGEASL